MIAFIRPTLYAAPRRDLDLSGNQQATAGHPYG